MRNGAYAIDIGKALPAIQAELRHHRDPQRLVAGAHPCEANQDVIARSNPTVGAPEAHEGRTLGLRDVPGCRTGEITRHFAHHRHLVTHVRVADDVACGDSFGSANRLTVLEDKSAASNIAESKALS